MAAPRRPTMKNAAAEAAAEAALVASAHVARSVVAGWLMPLLAF